MSDSKVRHRPSLWHYVSFSPSPSPSRPSRRGLLDDPYEKEARGYHGDLSSFNLTSHAKSNGSAFTTKPSSWKSLLLRIAPVAAVLLLVIYFLIPKRPSRVIVNQIPTSILTETGAGLGGTTTRCTVSVDPSKPLVQYALMVDAGSTGSRIHVYRFNNCGSTPELEDEIFEQTAKREGGSGLSSYDSDAEGAAKSLDVLMDVAVKSIPVQLQSCTPIAVKATAGLRKLGPEKSEKTLRAVRTRLESKYPFPVISQDKGGVEVMDGTDEGVYAWITTNYLLGRIGNAEEKSTVAVFDLGGGSTQIVFEPKFSGAETLADGDHKYSLDFGGRSFTLYQHSYLGYGLMAARDNLHQLVVLDAYEHAKEMGAALVHPCISTGQWREVDVPLPDLHPLGLSTIKVNMTGPAEPSPEACLALAERTLKKEAECSLSPCAFDGVHQPSLTETFAAENIYLFSYFYDRVQPLGMPDTFKIQDLKDLAEKVCLGERGWSEFAKIEGAVEELKDRPEHCLDLNFMLALLHKGYEMPLDREVKVAKKIEGRELGWCLGASLPLLSQESGWTCKLEKVA